MRRALFLAKLSHNRDKFGFCTNLMAAKARRTPPFIAFHDRSLWKVVILRTAWRTQEDVTNNIYVIDIMI